MSTRLNPYLNFDGTTRAAFEFYQGVFGGDLGINTFGDVGHEGPGADNVMHAQLESPSGYTLMGSDMPPGSEHRPGNNFAVSLSGDDAAELRAYWDKLSASGSVTMPLEKQVWGDEFGMCVDGYGITWMVNIAGQQG